MRRWLATGVAFGGGVVIAIALVMFGLGATNTLTPPSQAPSATPPPSELADSAAPPETQWQPGTPEYSDVDPSVIMDVNTQDNYELPADMSADEQSRAHGWMQTQAITALCMQEAGFGYTYIPHWTRDSAAVGFPRPWIMSLPESEQAGARLALNGDTGAAADYHWDDAGCWGYAVHVMGNDNAH